MYKHEENNSHSRNHGRSLRLQVQSGSTRRNARRNIVVSFLRRSWLCPR
nr:hypothetical protein [Muribaculum intestinale]